MNKKDKKSDEEFQYSFSFSQPYVVNIPFSIHDFDRKNGGFTDEAVNKLMSICDGDFDKLDKWISEQLALISEEIEEDKKQLSFDFDSDATLEEQRDMFSRLFPE